MANLHLAVVCEIVFTDSFVEGDDPNEPFSWTDCFRAWSGYPDLVGFEEPKVWIGLGELVGISANESTIGKPGQPITVTLSNIHQEIRARFREPIGHRLTRLRYIYSDDKGATWTVLPMTRIGYTSNPRMSGADYQFDIVHPFEILFRRRPRTWSNEDQRRRYPRDSGFAQMRSVASGVNIQFPFMKQQQESGND